jgi:1,2-phenylacetyl-CoA epoxidase catalytic subunit
MTQPVPRFIGQVTPAEVPQLPVEYRESLIRLLTITADSEVGVPWLLQPRWILSAPSADDSYRLAHIIADEIDHFRQLIGLLHELGVDRSDLLHGPREARLLEVYQPDDVNTWADVVCVCALVDRAGKHWLADMVRSSYKPLDLVLPRLLDAEAIHVGFGTARLGQLATNPETRAEAQAAVDRWYPRVLDFLGRGDAPWTEQYLAWGLRHRPDDEVQQSYAVEVSSLLNRIGLTVPDPPGSSFS